MKRFLKSSRSCALGLSLALALMAPSIGRAEIRELASFTGGSIEKEVDAQTWVIFDIDNTLLHPTVMIGSHQWGDYMFAQKRALGASEKEASAFQHQAYGSLQGAVPVAITESEVLGVIERLKQRGVRIFALTARSESIHRETLQQLKEIGVDLTRTAPALNAHIYDGVVFANGEPKGELLKRLIRESGVKPSKVVFADDKRYNLESLETSLAEARVPFLGFRYGFLDSEVAGFRSDLANTEWLEFKRTGHVMTDSQAAALIFSM